MQFNPTMSWWYEGFEDHDQRLEMQEFETKRLLLALAVALKLRVSAAHYLPWAVSHMQTANACVKAAKGSDIWRPPPSKSCSVFLRGKE